jgi:uncharacterized protein DUF3606
MADDLRQKRPQDEARISTSEDWEVRYWTKELGVTADQLKRLVAEHGNSAAKVRAALDK